MKNNSEKYIFDFLKSCYNNRKFCIVLCGSRVWQVPCCTRDACDSVVKVYTYCKEYVNVAGGIFMLYAALGLCLAEMHLLQQNQIENYNSFSNRCHSCKSVPIVWNTFYLRQHFISTFHILKIYYFEKVLVTLRRNRI